MEDYDHTTHTKDFEDIWLAAKGITEETKDWL
jgi:hypothetical protein